MSGQVSPTPRAMRGTIRSRLLVNALVEPDEAAQRLPTGLRPHVVGEGTVVGCCLLDIGDIRLARLPAVFGRPLRAAAHRISVEWEDDVGATAVGVYVPLRLTDSRAAIALGGRVFPGVHRRASIELAQGDGHIEWSVDAGAAPGAYSVSVEASPRDDAQSPCEPIGGTCLNAEIGLSPGHDGVLEAARMMTHHRAAHPVDISRLDSAFLASFTSATAAPSYLMRDVDVTWTRERVPQLRDIDARV